jgi:hypothetical protein
MNLNIITLVLDGAPYIFRHLPIFEKLSCPWRWHIVHGAAANVGSTAWCKPQEPRLSRDGTSEFVNSLVKHSNVRIYQKQFWRGGKDEMANAPLKGIMEPCCLMQIDSDEIWTADQLDKIVQTFEARPELYRMYFWCNYFLGPDIVSTSMNGYGNRYGEWLRAFRFVPGMAFQKHEPPVLAGNSRGLSLGRDATRGMGLVFDHFSWVHEPTVRAKMQFYGYGERGLAGWKRLQENKSWPVDLRQFLPFVGPGASADKVKI